MSKTKQKAVEVIVNDDFSYISPKDGKTYKMSFKERAFCDSYLDFKGNGVEAIYEAGYEVKSALVAAAMASDMLRKPNITAYINSKLEEAGLNDDDAFKQHLFLLNQHADLKSKAKAVDMYYKLKGTYAPEKSVNVNIDVPATPQIKELAHGLIEIQRQRLSRGSGTVSEPVGGTTPNQE